MTAAPVPSFDVWAQMPQVVNRVRPWSLVAAGVSEEQAETYRATFLFPLHVEPSRTPEERVEPEPTRY